MPIVVILVMTALGLLLGAQAEVQIASARSWQEKHHTLALHELGGDVLRYYRLYGNFPADWQQMLQKPGFEASRDVLEPGGPGSPSQPATLSGIYQLAVTNPPSNDGPGQFEYNRAAVWVDPQWQLNTQTGLSVQDKIPYLSAGANECQSTAGFQGSIDWCGRPDGYWWRYDEREAIKTAFIEQRARLQRLLKKLSGFYNESGKFPQPAGGTSETLANVVGYPSTVSPTAPCPGNTVWMDPNYSQRGVPLDCEDIYSVWGSPVTYNWLNASHIVLVARSPFRDGSGNTVYVATELQL